MLVLVSVVFVTLPVQFEEKNMEEVTIAEAAQRLGMSTDSVRRRISRGELKARKVNSSHGEMYLVEVPDDAPQSYTALQGKEEITQALETLRKAMSIMETELEARRREVQELHVLLQQAQAALPTGKNVTLNAPWWKRLLPWEKK